MFCCRDKLQASEGKLRSAIQDKANVVSEKAAIDRQLKALQAQTGKLTKVLVYFLLGQAVVKRHVTAAPYGHYAQSAYFRHVTILLRAIQYTCNKQKASGFC